MGSTIEVTITKAKQGIVDRTKALADLTWGKVVQNTLLFCRDRSTAYKVLFSSNSTASRIVWNDFLAFCKWREGAFHENSRVTDRILGRQDVLRRILEHVNLTPKQLMALYNSSPVPEDIVEDKETDDD